MAANGNLFKNVDKPIIGLYLVLVAIGWVTVFVSGYDFEQTTIFDLSYRSGMQFIWIGVSLAIGIAVLLIDERYYNLFAYVFYGAIILLLIATIFLANDIKGSRSWLVVGPISIQPAEFAKFATALALAKLMESYGFVLKSLKGWTLVGLLIIVPMLIIIMQKETGSALVFASFLLMLYREGLPGLVPLLLILAVALFIFVLRFDVPLWGVEGSSMGIFIAMLILIAVCVILLWYYSENKTTALHVFLGSLVLFGIAAGVHNFLMPLDFGMVATGIVGAIAIYLIVRAVLEWRKTYLLVALFAVGFAAFSFSVDYLFERVLEPHQQTRIKVMLGMEDDPTGVGYNVNQSRIAIGSGGFTGKGFLNGTQTKLKFVPEQDTDFIFCTIGEEGGFLGSVAVILLYIFLLARLIMLAEKQRTTFGRVYGYCVVGVLFFHLTINIGMVIGLAPVIGIPLPFISYGGSSLLAFTILLFIFLRLDMARKE